MRARRSHAALACAWMLVVASCFGCAHTPTPREHALILLSRGNTKEALVELSAIVDAHPSDPRAWIDLGHGYELARRYDDALAAYDRAADVAPTSPVGPREGGLRCAAWGEHAAASPRLAEAIKRGDDSPAIFHALGLTLLAQKKYPEAREAYRKGLAARGGDEDASNVLGLATLAVATSDAADALHWYDELLRRRPKLPAPWLGRAWALGKLGRISEAQKSCDEAAALGGRREEIERVRAWLADGAK